MFAIFESSAKMCEANRSRVAKFSDPLRRPPRRSPGFDPPRGFGASGIFMLDAVAFGYFSRDIRNRQSR
jgi:hypothetical protein